MITLINIARKQSGIGRYARDIKDALGNDCNLYSFRLDKNSPESNFDGHVVNGFYPPITSGWRLNLRFFRHTYRKSIQTLLQNNEKRIFHYIDGTIPPFTQAEKSLVTIHDLFSYYGEDDKEGPIGINRRTIQKYINFPNILTVSHTVRKELEEFGFNGKIEVIYPTISRNFVKLDNKIEIRKKLGLPESKKIILSISSILPRKNLRILPSTFAGLGDDFKLLRVGNKVMDNEINFSNVGEDTLNLLYNAADALVFPSLREGFGYPMVEAFSVGLPVVCSDIEIFHEIGGNGAKFVKSTPEDFAQGIKEALDEKEDMSQKALERSRLFNFENFKNRMLSYYQSLNPR